MHPGPRADIAPWKIAAGRAGQHRGHVIGRDVPAANVVEALIVAFRDHRQRHVIVDADVRIATHQVRDHAVVGAADVERVGEHDRRLEKAGLIDPVRARQLAVAVEGEGRRGDAIVPGIDARQNAGRAGAHVAAFDLRHETDAHARNVRDRVIWSARKRSDSDGGVRGAHEYDGGDEHENRCAHRRI